MAEQFDSSTRPELESRLGFEALLADLSAHFVNLPAAQVDDAIRDTQCRICEFLGLDLSVLWQWAGDDRSSLILTHLYGDVAAPPVEPMAAKDFFPWCQREILAGRTIVVSSMDNLPPEAAQDVEAWRYYGVKTSLTFPLSIGGEPPVGALSFNTTKTEREWSAETVNRLRLVAQVFANALARKCGEEALRESEARLSLAAEAADAGLWILDAESGRFWTTKQILAIFGFPSGIDITMDAFVATVHPEDRERIRQTVEESLRENREVMVEYRIIHPDGRFRWIASRGRPHSYIAGKPNRLMGILMDITARKQTEALLHEHQVRLAAAVELAGFGVYTMRGDPPADCLDEQAGKLIGFPPGEESRARNFWMEHIHPDDRERLQRCSRELLGGKVDKISAVYRYLHPQEGVRWLNHISCVLERDREGLALHTVGLVQDITDSRRAELALAESERLKAAILSSLASHVAVIGPDGTIVTVNETWRRYGEENGGMAAVSAPGANYLAAVRRAAESGSKDAAAAMAGIRQVLDGEAGRFEYGYSGHSPTRQRWFMMIVTPFQSPAGGAVISHVDVTELKESQLALARACEEIQQLKDRLQQENVYLRQEVNLNFASNEIIGQSEAIRGVLRLAGQVAPTDSSVLLMGETGTGKELVAKFIHQLSPRHARLMVKVNCSSLPATLIESELFGREKGAFTGALTRQPGRFEVADGSTLFLDEIGELPLDLQAKLLQVLQDGRFERLGSSKTISVNVRIIAATNRDLADDVRKGRFRQDLYYRLNVFPIHLPPLRERTEDIPLMVRAFVDEFAGKLVRKINKLPRRTMDAMLRYAWPGNIRELRKVIERAVIVSTGDTLDVDLPTVKDGDARPVTTLADAEADHIRAVLKRTDGRIKGAGGAAALLGMKPSTLYTRMKKLGIPTRTQDDQR